MSEFRESGLGSWAQWQGRVKKAGGYFTLSINSGDVPGGDAWEVVHLRRMPGYSLTDADVGVESVERDVADRKAG